MTSLWRFALHGPARRVETLAQRKQGDDEITLESARAEMEKADLWNRFEEIHEQLRKAGR
jgi:hypothetical protein